MELSQILGGLENKPDSKMIVNKNYMNRCFGRQRTHWYHNCQNMSVHKMKPNALYQKSTMYSPECDGEKTGRKALKANKQHWPDLWKGRKD